MARWRASYAKATFTIRQCGITTQPHHTVTTQRKPQPCFHQQLRPLCHCTKGPNNCNLYWTLVLIDVLCVLEKMPPLFQNLALCDCVVKLAGLDYFSSHCHCIVQLFCEIVPTWLLNFSSHCPINVRPQAQCPEVSALTLTEVHQLPPLHNGASNEIMKMKIKIHYSQM